MVKVIGECSVCGDTKSLLGSGLCGSCSGKRGGRPARKPVDESVLSPALIPVIQTVKVKPRKTPSFDILEYLFGDDVDPITDEKSGKDGEGLDSTLLVIGAGVALIVIYALYGDRLKGLIVKLTSKLEGGKKPDNPYSAPAV